MLKIVEKSKLYFAISAIVIIIGIIGLIINGGFKMSVDFAGGLNMYVDMSAYVEAGNEIDLDAIAKVVQDNTPGDVQPTVLRSDGNQIVIKTITFDTPVAETAPAAEETAVAAEETAVAAEETAVAAEETAATAEETAATAKETAATAEETAAVATENASGSALEIMKSALLSTYSLPEEAIIQVENIDPTVGKELSTQAFTATLIAAILMLLYITIRFEFKTGVSAIICLLHDVLIMMAFYAVFQIPIDTNFIAAVLTIIGYSINNTIVVFDRIRENYAKARRLPFAETVNKSIFQTLGRSICTTVTTLLPIVMLCILGVTSIRQFTLTLIIGLLAGTYSSVFLAGSVWAWLKGIQDKMKMKRAQR